MPTVQGGNSPVIPDDVRRMDWLVSKTVDVREPMVYGSHSLSGRRPSRMKRMIITRLNYASKSMRLWQLSRQQHRSRRPNERFS